MAKVKSTDGLMQIERSTLRTNVLMSQRANKSFRVQPD